MKSPLSQARRGAFTLVELLTVVVIIMVLVGMVVGISGYAQTKQARAKATADIGSLATACENYKADYGAYPRHMERTDNIDPKLHGDPIAPNYRASSLYLYAALSGDFRPGAGEDGATQQLNALPSSPDGRPETKSYYPFKESQLGRRAGGTTSAKGPIEYIKDPYGNSYGYSTAGFQAEEEYQHEAAKDPNVSRPEPMPGYNNTFDLWSTGGLVGRPASAMNEARWLKNW